MECTGELALAMHSLVCLQTLQYLQQNAKERAELAANASGSSTNFNAPTAASKLSMQELEELRKQLGSVATGTSLQQVGPLHCPRLCACCSTCASLSPPREELDLLCKDDPPPSSGMAWAGSRPLGCGASLWGALTWISASVNLILCFF